MAPLRPIAWITPLVNFQFEDPIILETLGGVASRCAEIGRHFLHIPTDVGRELDTYRELIADGRLTVRRVAAEDFTLQTEEQPYDLVFAVRVGALDGRHPRTGEQVLARIAAATCPDARLFIDGGDPLRELSIPRGR